MILVFGYLHVSAYKWMHSTEIKKKGGELVHHFEKELSEDETLPSGPPACQL